MNETLQAALAGLIDGLATFFGTTTEAIMKDFPTFLARYGWYDTLTELPGAIFLGLICGLAFVGVIAMIKGCCTGYGLEHPVLWSISFSVIGMLIGVAIVIIPCYVVPEIV